MMEDLLMLREKTKKLNILFVDDSDIVRVSTVAFLEDFFDEIFVASNGKEGFDSYLDYKDEIDIVISDINMPVMNGFDMVNLIRKDNSTLPILFLTGSSNTNPDSKERLEQSGIKHMLLKPIVISEFVKSVNDILD